MLVALFQTAFHHFLLVRYGVCLVQSADRKRGQISREFCPRQFQTTLSLGDCVCSCIKVFHPFGCLNGALSIERRTAENASCPRFPAGLRSSFAGVIRGCVIKYRLHLCDCTSRNLVPIRPDVTQFALQTHEQARTSHAG